MEVDEAPHASRDMKANNAALAASQKRDGEIMDVLIKQVVPKAITFFLEGPLQQSMSSPGEEIGDEEEDSDGFELVGRSGCHGGNISSLPYHSQRIAHALKVRHAYQRMKMHHVQSS